MKDRMLEYDTLILIELDPVKKLEYIEQDIFFNKKYQYALTRSVPMRAMFGVLLCFVFGLGFILLPISITIREIKKYRCLMRIKHLEAMQKATLEEIEKRKALDMSKDNNASDSTINDISESNCKK